MLGLILFSADWLCVFDGFWPPLGHDALPVANASSGTASATVPPKSANRSDLLVEDRRAERKRRNVLSDPTPGSIAAEVLPHGARSPLAARRSWQRHAPSDKTGERRSDGDSVCTMRPAHGARQRERRPSRVSR